MKEITLEDLRVILQEGRRLRRFKAYWNRREYDVEPYEYRHDIVLVVADKLLKEIQDKWRTQRWADVGLKAAKSPGVKGVTPWIRWAKSDVVCLNPLNIANALTVVLDHPHMENGTLRLYEPSGSGRLVPLHNMRTAGSRLLFDISDSFSSCIAKAAEKHIRNSLG